MFYLSRDIQLDSTLLAKMINRFYMNVEPKLIKYKNYYDGNQAILQKIYADETKPCNRTVINYCKNIVDSYCGYIASPGYISYSSNDNIEEIMDVLNYNDYQAEDSDILLDALVYGTAAELMYVDEDAKLRFRAINPTTCFAVFDDTLSGDLIYFVRIYKNNDWDESNLYNVDVYNDSAIQHYQMTGRMGVLTYLGETPHYFGQCPANIFYLPDEKSIFDCIMSEQDSVNELISDEIDDYSAFCDAYLGLTGVDADAEDIAKMKENRVLLLPEGATAEWITKNSNDTQVENILKTLQEAIYRTSQCVDFSLENVGGGISSGIAIRYRLTGMENRSGIVEGRMKKALQRRIEIICGFAALKLGEEIFRDIKINFKRNIPSDNADMVNLVNALKGIVSDKTLLGSLPIVNDVNEELKELEKQRKSSISLYDFGDE